jgi:hypothetical protein
MKVVVLYRPNSEHERSVIEFAREFERRTGHKLGMISLDTLDGDNTARLYDITEYPAVLASTDDGALQKVWQGERLPLMNEVSFYTSTAGAGAAL